MSDADKRTNPASPVFEYQGRKVVKCADCQTIYDAIGFKCPECGSEDVLERAGSDDKPEESE